MNRHISASFVEERSEWIVQQDKCFSAYDCSPSPEPPIYFLVEEIHSVSTGYISSVCRYKFTDLETLSNRFKNCLCKVIEGEQQIL